MWGVEIGDDVIIYRFFIEFFFTLYIVPYMSQNHNDNHGKFQLYDEFLFLFYFCIV